MYSKRIFPACPMSPGCQLLLQLVSDVWLSWGPRAPLLSDLDSETLLIEVLHIGLLPTGNPNTALTELLSL